MNCSYMYSGFRWVERMAGKVVTTSEVIPAMIWRFGFPRFGIRKYTCGTYIVVGRRWFVIKEG